MRMDEIESVHYALNFPLFRIFFYIDLFLKVRFFVFFQS